VESRLSGLVTIGIPTWNRSGFVMDAVQSCLNQTYENIEIVVSDNASTDDTWERLNSIEDPRLSLIRQDSNIGGSGNSNACLQRAHGELFLHLCDDDLLEPTAIEKLSKPFREGYAGTRPDSIGLTWTPSMNVDHNRKLLWITRCGPPIESAVSLMEGLFSGTRGPQWSGVLVRAADARKFGYDGARHVMLGDTSNWGRVALQYDNVVCVQEPLMRYTIHAGADSSHTLVGDWQIRGEIMFADFIEVLRARGDSRGEERLMKVKNRLMANLTVTVLMRYKGRPGWVPLFLKEVWRSRGFMLTPFVAKRFVKDGWKLLRL
jgi:glycosyltransferase involved in cell wall biosynthesis